MKKSKKFLALLCGLALSVSLLAGCTSEKKTGTENKTAEQKKEQKEEQKKEQEDKIDFDKYVTLGEYKSISLETSNIDAQVQTQIDTLLENQASYDKVTKGKVADGDTVNIHYVGKMDGKEFEGGALRKEDSPEGYDLTIGSNSFIDGFEEALIGKEIGGTYDINVTFPEKYESSPDLAGKPAVFTVTINSKQGEKHLPELNDEFIKKNVSGFDSVEAYKKDLRDTAVQEQAWSQVYKASKINDYPKAKLEEFKERMKASMEYYLGQQGMSLDAYMQAQNVTEEQMDEQMEQSAKQTTGEWLVYNTIAEKEKIEVTEEEYHNTIQEIMTANNLKDEADVDKLFKDYYGSTSEEILSDDLLGESVRKYLSGNVSEK